MKIMIMSPHMDDEVLGCSSWLREKELTVVYAAKTHPDFLEIREENDRLQKLLNFERRWLPFGEINHFDVIPQALIIEEFEQIVSEVHPDLMLVPSPSYNQDHRALFDAMLTACRPHDKNWLCKKILSYEQPETWGTMRTAYFFHANYFRELDLEFKLTCYAIYASQVRGHRSVEHIRALATFRGMQCEKRYAEAFEVLRWID